MKRKLLSLAIVLLLMTVPAAAQELDQFISNDGQLTFQHPNTWAITEDESITIEGDVFTAILHGPTFTASFELENAESPAEALAILLPDAGSIEVTENNGVEIASAPYTNPDGTEGIYFAVMLAGEHLRILNAYNSDGEIADSEAEILDLIATLEFTPTAGTSLRQFSASWQEAIDELEEKELISSGGSLIFQENRAFFSGQGSWFMPLATRAPRTDIVIAGNLKFTTGDPGLFETEYCSLTSRIVVENDAAVRYLDVGLDSDGYIFYLDQYGVGTFDFHSNNILLDGFDPEIAHHYLILALDDQLTVFVDGEIVFEGEIIDERAGSYGVSLLGHGPNALCEATDIWAYEAPSFAPGVCEISTTSVINKRGGPSTNFDSVGQLQPNDVQRATGKTLAEDGFLWWQLEDESWVREDVVNAQGDCRSIAEVE